MSTTTIAIDQDVATLINVFAVTRENQQPLVGLLIEATEQVMRYRPGPDLAPDRLVSSLLSNLLSGGLKLLPLLIKGALHC